MVLVWNVPISLDSLYFKVFFFITRETSKSNEVSALLLVRRNANSAILKNNLESYEMQQPMALTVSHVVIVSYIALEIVIARASASAIRGSNPR